MLLFPKVCFLKKKHKTSPNHVFLLLIKHTCFYKTLLPLDSAALQRREFFLIGALLGT